MIEYDRMIDTGILMSGEPYELIDGLIIHKDRSARGENPMTIGAEHMWGVSNLGRIGRNLDRFGCYIQTQGPVIMAKYHEPEPDGAVLVGTEDDYKLTKPTFREVSCVIEVADSSLGYDRGTKLAIYAGSGIPQYILINLVDKVVEVYTQPKARAERYGQTKILRPGDAVAFSLPRGQVFEIPAKNLLP
ncbi:MAG TPA: Uma2 family endonuclease [Humisphaera sp.]|nr:Uma2 family endonuclease [Humisphaera sp.]